MAGSSNFASGLLAGCATTILFHPLDLVKTRFQVDESRWRKGHVVPSLSTKDLIVSIRDEIGFKGLYRGLVPAMVGASISWGIYFALYEDIKTRIAGEEQRRLLPYEYLMASAGSGTITTLCTNPIWLVKTRMELQTPGNEPYKGLVHALRTIVKQDGAKGLYKGIAPALVLVSNGGMQFMLYEEFKHVYNRPLNSLDHMALGALSKGLASVITYPYQVVKSRMQQYHSTYHSTSYTFRSIVRGEGIAGLYSGLIPNLSRVMPSSAVTFAVYEACKKLFST